LSHAITAKIYDLASNELADISGIALEKSMQRRLNLPRVFTIQAPAGDSLLTAVTADDDLPNLVKGARKLVVWEDGGPGDAPIFHGRVGGVERNGDGEQNLVTITALMPIAELGYDERAGRVVRGSTVLGGSYDGNFINPQFSSSVEGQDEISGPDLIWQVLNNSRNTGAESDLTPGEGPLPIYLPDDPADGPFDLDVPPAVDLSPFDTMDWPMMVGDFIQQLTSTGVCDVDEIPLDIEDAKVAADPYLMSELTARSRLGTDRSATVNFDYFTGDHNAMACRLSGDFFAGICNKLYDFFGPRRDKNRWAGNMTPSGSAPGSPWPSEVTDPIFASRALYGGPGETPGQFMSIRVLDSLGNENSYRPLYAAVWLAEAFFRNFPRDMLYITPNPDAKALFEPPVAFDVGDRVAVNVGSDFGVDLAATQRVYGYDRTWSRENVARTSQLITSAVEE